MALGTGIPVGLARTRVVSKMDSTDSSHGAWAGHSEDSDRSYDTGRREQGTGCRGN